MFFFYDKYNKYSKIKILGFCHSYYIFHIEMIILLHLKTMIKY